MATLDDVKVMHGDHCVALQVSTVVVVLTPAEADQLWQKIRDQARYARQVTP